jgi:DNA primase
MKQKNYIERDKKWREFKERLDYLKQSVDVKYLLESLGFDVLRDTPKEIRSTCLIHGGDNTTAFRFNKDRRTWVCFTHKCHESFGNDIIALIKAVKNVDFMGAVDYLKRLTGDIGDGSGLIVAKQKRERDDFMESYKKESRPTSRIVNENSLKQFKKFRSDFFRADGFSDKTLDHFEIAGGYTDSFGFIRDIIPIRDDKNRLMAYSMRDIRRDVDDDFKYILTKNFDKDSVIYNLNKAKHFVNDLPLIVVEGFKSVWRLYDYGIENVVAVMGSKITEGQENLLCQYAYKGVVIMFDNDEAGMIGTVSALENLSHRLNIDAVFITEIDENGKGLDPADLSKEEVYSYLGKYLGG